MPILFGKEEFHRALPPADLSLDEEIFYLDQTKEIFNDYDAYFERLIQLNSMEWSSSLSGKIGLTYEEAVESETDARTFIDSFPEYLENPLLFLTHKFSSRTRIDDLVNDVFVIMKDRYFIGEEVMYREKSAKKNARISSVSYSGGNWSPKKNKQNAYENGTTEKDGSKKPKHKAAEPELPPPNSYLYTIQILRGDESDEDSSEDEEDDDGVREMVLYSTLSRPKDFSTKHRLKIFLRYTTEVENGILVVKPSLIMDHRLEQQLWTSIFAGPLPEFPQMAKVFKAKPSEKAEKSRKSINEKKEAKSTTKSPKEEVNGTKTEKPKKKSELEKSAEKAKKLSKQQKKILTQQEDLKSSFEQGEKFGVIGLEKWRQTERLLMPEEIEALKAAVKEAKEQRQLEERERLKEQRRREREELAERRKPRDDLLCDDLEPLPDYRPLELPSWVSAEMFAELLSLHQFFVCFAELLDIRDDSVVSFNNIVNAVFSNNPQKSPISELLSILLRAKAERANEEDGDEADIDNTDDIGNEANCDLYNKVHGEHIRKINRLHENYRITYGESPRNLPSDWLTVTEVLYLNLKTAGYYPSGKIYSHRYFNRGGIRCYEDPGYEFVLENAEIFEKLSQVTVFELNPQERLALLQVLTRQLLTYTTYRDTLDERMNSLQETKKQLKQLKVWDAAQEKEAKEAKLSRESEKEQSKEQGEKSDADEKKSDKSKLGKEVVKIRAYIKAVNDGRRIFNLDEVKSIMLADVPYDEMELYEIGEVRQHQKSLYEEKINGLQELMCDLYAQIGLCFLGRDRTYRSYYFLEAIPIVLVEEPASISIDECEQPTPLQLKHTNETNNNLDEERIRLLACTGSNQTCPIHGASRSFPRWSYLSEKGTVDKLLEACNRRGFREMELADNITNIRQILSKTIDEQISTLSEEEILNHLALSPQPEEFPVENIFQDLEREIRAMILDLEEKIETRAIGRIECATDRETWRDSLEQTGDTTAYCFKNEVRIKYTSKHAEPVFKGEQLSELDSIARLAIALLQLAQGIKLECLNPPFTQEKDKKDPKVLPSTTFVNWQQELLSSKSISRIALLFNTLEVAIEWTQLRGQGNKCKICHKRGNIENLAQCRDCDRCYHTTCAKFKIPKLYDWQCPDCVEAEKIKQSKKKGRRLRDELEQHRGMNDVYEDDMNSDVGAGSSHENGWSDSKEKNYSLRGSRKRGETSDRKSDTRDDRKRRATARTSYINYFEKDDSYSDASSGDFSRKRRKTAENLNIRALSMGLRESDSSEIKRQLQLCEEIVRATMHHECGLPFTDPVNLKEYPDYIEVIKYPMDLRKIMSKLKYFEYDTAGQVWDDFKLIFDNCRTYNDEDSEVHEYADKLQSFVAEKFRKGFGMKV